jgi:ribosomal protein S18 acetylase RimI-like enzyme
MTPFVIRAGRQGDAKLIVDSWTQSHSKRAARPQERREGYETAQREAIAALLEDSRTAVAVDPSNSDAIYGYAVAEPGPEALLHWVWVRNAFRRDGIGRALVRHLLGEKPEAVTCTEAVTTWQREKLHALGWRVAYRVPYLRAITKLVAMRDAAE